MFQNSWKSTFWALHLLAIALPSQCLKDLKQRAQVKSKISILSFAAKCVFKWALISRLVIDTLEKVERDRKCFRLVGGVLVERSVGEVQPALTGNRDKLTKLIETLEKQLTEKGQEINGYIEKHNIQIQGKKGPTTSNAPAVEENKKTQSTGVLV